jgi:hypothetical protein
MSMKLATTLVHKGAMPIAVHAIRTFRRHFTGSYRLEIHTDGSLDAPDHEVLMKAADGMPAGIVTSAERKPIVGGHWPDTARVALVVVVLASREGRDERRGIRLLSDLRKIFGSDKYKLTAAILQALAEVDESPWADIRGKPLTDVGLAELLRDYGIKPKTIRVGNATPRGYWREDFEDAWRRCCPPVSEAQNTRSMRRLADLAQSNWG